MSEQSTREALDADKVASFRELREYARGRLDVEHHDVHPIAGLIDDDDVRDVLAFMAENYDPSREDLDAGMPRSFWDTSLARKAVRKHATRVATEAVRDGNLTQVSYVTGLPSYESDVSGLHAINQLADWLIHSEQTKLVYLAALMGRGKTDLSLTLLEIIDDHYRRVRRSVEDFSTVPEFAANFHVEADGDAEVAHIDNYDDLVEWGERGSSDDERWFVFDEASTELTAQSGANAQNVAETMAPFVKKMRKMGINMVVIGHDKGDVHVAIRSLADFVDKTGLKSASFYAGIKKREPTGHLFDVDGIPATSWSFDTDDTADWDWCLEDGEDAPVSGVSDEEMKEMRDERMARLYALTGISQEKIGKAFDVSPATVSRAVRAYDVEMKNEPATA